MFSGTTTGWAGSKRDRPTSCAPVTEVASVPIDWPNWVAIMVPINERSIMVIISIGGWPSEGSPACAFIAWSSKLEIALDKPAANGSIVLCQPAIVWSTQSRRVAEVGAIFVAGNERASSSQTSEIWNALSTTANSLVVIGFKPWAVTNFLAVSRAVEIERVSSLPFSPPVVACEKRVVKGLTNPIGLIPSCSNCAFICSCIWRIIASKSGRLFSGSLESSGIKPNPAMKDPNH